MSTIKILVVEDESIVALDLEHRLKRLGYAVPGSAATGAEAIEKAKELRPDLVLMDIRLRGEMDGVEAAHKIWDDFNIPVVYLSAFGDTETLERAKLTEPFGYLIKPFDERELQATIEMAFVKYQAHRTIQQVNVELERKVAERTVELTEANAKLRALLAAMNDVILVLNSEGRYLDIAPTNATLLYKLPAELVGKTLHEVFDTAQADAFLGHIQHALASKQTVRTEYSLIINDRKIFFEASISPMTAEAVVWVARDISALKEVARMKEAFVSNVSHELRTPITSLKVYHTLLKSTPPEKQPEYLTAAEREIERLSLIIEDLLRLSHLDQGRVELNIEHVDLGELAHQYLSDRRPLALQREITVSLDSQPNVPLVPADEGLLGQVLSIMLSNAINYTPPGGHVLISTARQQTNGRRWASFSVRDTGPGIPPDEYPYLFERFFRGTGGLASSMPGTGLGLSIAKEIVELHDGRIEVDSAGVSGQGTTLTRLAAN